MHDLNCIQTGSFKVSAVKDHTLHLTAHKLKCARNPKVSLSTELFNTKFPASLWLRMKLF
jgi:hypothetical protein